MRIKIYKAFSFVSSLVVFAVVKIADAVGDAFYWINSFFKSLFSLWALIWKGFELSNLFQIIGLSFGSFIVAGKMANTDLLQMSEKRKFIRNQNVLLGTTNTYYETALFRLTNAAQPT